MQYVQRNDSVAGGTRLCIVHWGKCGLSVQHLAESGTVCLHVSNMCFKNILPCTSGCSAVVADCS
jgi:hypothetical protein